jgi:hypothetical protein
VGYRNQTIAVRLKSIATLKSLRQKARAICRRRRPLLSSNIFFDTNSLITTNLCLKEEFECVLLRKTHKFHEFCVPNFRFLELVIFPGQ